MKKIYLGFFCLLYFSFSYASGDNYALGTGRNNALTVTTAGTIINSYAQVTSAISVNAATITIGAVTGTSIVAGDLIMIHQSTGITPSSVSGSSTAIDLGSTDNVGSYELARIGAISGSTITLSSGTIRSFPALVTQIIRVPEYTSVTINAAGRIVATPWNGSIGGVVAFLVSGTVSNLGQINASTAGFRGGVYSDDFSGNTGCSAMDQSSPAGGQKGEGLTNIYGAAYGSRGNLANGGGGGACIFSGGGGGGNGGSGGQGGKSDLLDGSRQVGGMGGVSLIGSIPTYLTFGGAGGAGHGSEGTGTVGGRGGGIIFIRANQLSGTGSITSNGGGASTTSSDGGSGGGGGGTIYLRIASSASSGNITAAGGPGGSINADNRGPGGGGGGGRIFLQRASGGTINPNVIPGSSGVQSDASAIGGLTYGATSGSAGTINVITAGFVSPPAPVIINSFRSSSGIITVNGTTTSGYRVRVGIGTNYYTVVADGAGLWSASTPNPMSGVTSVNATSIAPYNEESPTTTFSNILSLEFVSFVAQISQGNVVLKWSAYEQDVNYYQLQRSVNGVDWVELQKVNASNRRGTNTYTSKDLQVTSGRYYYRLVVYEMNGDIHQSTVQSVLFTQEQQLVFSIWPNPAKDKITLTGVKAGMSIRLLDVVGKVLQVQKAASTIENIVLSSLSKGLYTVQVYSVDGLLFSTAQVMKE